MNTHNRVDTKTITSRDIAESKRKINLSSVLGYQVRTVTMHADSENIALTKEQFNTVLEKIARPPVAVEQEKK